MRTAADAGVSGAGVSNDDVIKVVGPIVATAVTAALSYVIGTAPATHRADANREAAWTTIDSLKLCNTRLDRYLEGDE